MNPYEDMRIFAHVMEAGSFTAAADLLDTADDAPVIRLINGIIAEAVRAGASDIHLEPFESALTVRMRVDGVLREALRSLAMLGLLDIRHGRGAYVRSAETKPVAA